MKEYFYEVHISWKDQRRGLLKSPGAAELKVLTPNVPMPGQHNSWTPEQLLAGSLSSCFMRAFLDLAEQTGLTLQGYRSQCFIKMEQQNGSYHPVALLLQPLVTLQDKRSIQTANSCLEEAEQICCLNKLLRIQVDVHPQVECV